MKGAVFHGPHQPLVIEEVEMNSPMAREMVVRTVASGVCRSDAHYVDGLYGWPAPAVLGHEASGIVEQVGPLVTKFQPGDHVIANLSVFCGHCEYCLTGHPNLCPKIETRRGPDQEPKLRLASSGEALHDFFDLSSFADRMLLHENAAVKIGGDVPLDVAALISCGVMTGMGAALNCAKVEPGSTCAVFGAGGVGLSAIQGCRIAGAGRVIAVDVIAKKLDLALELGATDAIDSSTQDPVATVRALTGGGADYTFDAIGLAAVSQQAFDALRPGGLATVIGMIPEGDKVALDGPAFLQEKKIQGTDMGSNRALIDMPRYVDFYRRGMLRLDEMVTRHIALEDVNDAFRAMKAGEVARSVIMFETSH
jgi:S-(hydroxymethyl)glutathione dehydrogenase/alcohol dehydrogenase